MTGVDILLTNPEAFDFLYVDPNINKARIIGKDTFNDHVKYIVFDEAHYWTGASGSAIHMLNERLRFFYGDKIKVFIVSATIKDPRNFGEKLTGRTNIPITFVPETINYSIADVDLYKIPPAFPSEAFDILFKSVSEKSEKLIVPSSKTDYTNELKLLQSLGYIENETDLTLVSGLSLLELDYENFEDFLLSPEFVKDLKQKVIENVPEILHLRDFLSAKNQKPINFTPLMKIIEDFTLKLDIEKRFSREELIKLTTCLLTIGRIADLLQDRLHYFIRGNDGINYCDECKIISNEKKCSKCGKVLDKQLFFCATCHNILYANICNKEIGEAEDLGLMKYDLLSDKITNEICPQCNSNLKLTNKLRDGSVFHPQLLSQFSFILRKKITHKKNSCFCR